MLVPIRGNTSSTSQKEKDVLLPGRQLLPDIDRKTRRYGSIQRFFKQRRADQGIARERVKGKRVRCADGPT